MAQQRCAHGDREQRATPAIYRMTTVRERASSVLSPNAAGLIDSHSFDQFYTPRNDPRNGASERGPTTAQRMQRFLESAPPLAIDAARLAIADAAVDTASITHLVVVTCTGFGSPGLEFALIDGLVLRRNISRTQIGFMGCHGMFNGMAVAKAFTEADPDARVLLVSVELCSLHFQYGWNTQRVVANALFADGAAAMVIGPGSDQSRWTLNAMASEYIEDTADQMSWHVGDHGFEMTLAPTVPAAIGSNVRTWMQDWLAQHDLTIDAIGSWAIHPGGPRIVSAVANALSLDESAVAISRDVLASRGNMSSATIGFILQRMCAANTDKPIVAMSFGPGLTAEAALLRKDV